MKLLAGLTKRETQIAELLAWGAAKKEVAERLCLSTRTVENTARNIYQKIGIQKATELCVWWFVTKAGVSLSLDPLKRTIVAVALLVVISPCALSGRSHQYRRTRRPTIERQMRPRARRGEEDFITLTI